LERDRRRASVWGRGTPPDLRTLRRAYSREWRAKMKRNKKDITFLFTVIMIFIITLFSMMFFKDYQINKISDRLDVLETEKNNSPQETFPTQEHILVKDKRLGAVIPLESQIMEICGLPDLARLPYYSYYYEQYNETEEEWWNNYYACKKMLRRYYGFEDGGRR